MTSAANDTGKTKLTQDSPDPVDLHVGSRLRLRRNLMGMSQDQLGKASGLTFQQIQKYEHGTNRIAASRLFQLATLLNVQVSWFFEGFSVETDISSKLKGFDQSPTSSSAEGQKEADPLLYQRETLELIRAYYNIPDTRQRRKILELIKSMAGEELS